MSIILTIILAKIISLYLAKTLLPESFYMTTLMNIKNTRERGAKKERIWNDIHSRLTIYYQFKCNFSTLIWSRVIFFLVKTASLSFSYFITIYCLFILMFSTWFTHELDCSTATSALQRHIKVDKDSLLR